MNISRDQGNKDSPGRASKLKLGLYLMYSSGGI